LEQTRLNEKIRAPKVLLIDETGSNLGTVNTRDALQKAKEAGLDLVEVNGGQVPVCKLMDFGKYKYEQVKKDKLNSKKQTITVTKEIKFRPTTGDNDLVYRAKQVDEFIKEKNKVRLAVRFRGREAAHIRDTGKTLLEKFLSMLTTSYNIESEMAIEGGSIAIIIAP